jgi:hypothetical protein
MNGETQTTAVAADEVESSPSSPALDDEAILGYGDVATKDRVTDYEALAAGKKAPPKKARGSELVLVAAGFPGYANAGDEIQRLKDHSWFPNTPDFLATAEASTKSKPLGAGNASQFFGALRAAKGPIARLTLIGHGSPTGLGLSGDTWAHSDQILAPSDLVAWKTEIEAQRKKFSPGATIDIVACTLAVAGDLARHLAAAFGVGVRAFSEGIAWCVKFTQDGQILSRGKVACISDVTLEVERDCDHKVWKSKVNELKFPPPIRP